MRTGKVTPIQKLFLSYARSDDTEFVAKLYHDLTHHGFNVWWDMKEMPNRALTFLQEIRDAVHEADRLIAIIGPNAIKSDYVRAEWEHALLFCKGIVPIMRIGDYNSIPPNLNEDLFTNVPKLHCPDFRDKRPYEEAIQELLRILSQPLVQLGDLTGVPPLPPHYQLRKDDLIQIGKIALEDTQAPVVITAEKDSSVLYGMGGIGKTVLASAFARLRDVRRTFHDGLMWLRIGQEPNILQRMQDVAYTLGNTDADFSNKDSARNHLSHLLANKCCLIVLDNVWKIDDVVPFCDAINGSRCRLLITTRNKKISVDLGVRDVKVNLLSNESSLKLFAAWTGVSVEKLPSDDAKKIIEHCGRLPLALTMAGAMLREQPLSYWKNVLHKFETADIEKIRKDFGQDHYPYDNLLLSMHISVEALEPELQARYLDFTVFPEDIPVPESVIKVYWLSVGLDENRSEDIINTLVRHSLAFRDFDDRIYLHDIQRDYVRRKVVDLKSLHNRLLDAYCRLLPSQTAYHRWLDSKFYAWHTGPDDGYYFQNLAWHMVKADRRDQLKKLLFDYRWIKARLLATNIRALLADYDYVKENDALISIQIVLRLSSHILDGDRSQLASQLLGRLTAQTMEMKSAIRAPLHFLTSFYRRLIPQPYCIESLLRQITTSHDSLAWLRPISPSLASLRGSNSILFGHHSTITAIAQACSVPMVISASEEGQLIVWNMESGMDVLKLQGHTDRINGVALTADGKFAVSASNDMTIRIWDLHSGNEAWRFTKHVNRPWKVAVDSIGRQLISGDTNGDIFSYDFQLGGKAKIIKSLGGWIRSLEITRNDQLVIVATDLGLSVGNLQTHVWEDMHGCDSKINCAKITPDFRNIICGGDDGNIYIWNISTKRYTETIKAHDRRINAVEISGDGKIMLSGSEDETIAAWHFESRKYLGSYSGHAGFVTDICILHGKDMFLSGSEDRTLRLNDLRLARNKHFRHIELKKKVRLKLKQIPHPFQRAFIITVTPLILRILMTFYYPALMGVENDDKEEKFNLKKRLLGSKEHGHKKRVIAIIPQEKGMVVSVSSDGIMLVWDPQTGRRLGELACPIYHDRGKDHLLCASGRTLITLGSYRGYLNVIEMVGAHFGTYSILAGNKGEVTAVTVDAQGRYAAVAFVINGIELWDLYSQKKIRSFKSFNYCNTVYALAFLNNGRYVLSTSEDNTIRVWDVQTGNELRRLYKNVAYLSLSRSDTIDRLSRPAELIDLDSGRIRMDKKYPRNRSRSIIAIPDEQSFVVGFENGILNMYDFNSLELLWSLQAHADFIQGLSITSDGKYLASISDDRSMKIWRLAKTPIHLSTFTCDYEMTSCSIAENGQVFVAGDTSGQVHFLRLERKQSDAVDIRSWYGTRNALSNNKM